MIAWFFASHLISRFAGGGLLKLFFGNLMDDLKAVVAFLKTHSIWLTVSIALCLCWGVDHVISHRHAAKVEKQLSKAIAGRESDRKAYVKAQTAAAALNLAHNAADAAARERITHDVSQSYQAQLASLRANLARRLRAPTAAPQGTASQSDLPGVSPAPSGPDGSTRLSVPTSLYVRGAELELQLERLQQWVAEQLKVKTN